MAVQLAVLAAVLAAFAAWIAVARRRGAASAAPMPFAQAGADGLGQGTHRLTGTSHGIAWTLETVRLSAERGDDDMSPVRDVAKAMTRWSAPECAVPGGACLLLMNLPEGPRKQRLLEMASARPGTGMLASLTNKAGGLLLKAFARGYFGAERAQGMPLEPGQRLALPAGLLAQEFVAYTNDRPLAERVLVPEVADRIAALSESELSFLLDGAGLHAAAPTSSSDPTELVALAETCAAIAAGIRDRLG